MTGSATIKVSKISLKNVFADSGIILRGLHTSYTFMKEQGMASAMVPATKREVTLTFENVQPSTFAIMMKHDANDNKQMDIEADGMPKESYGTSGEMNIYSPPSFETSKFEVTDKDQEIRIRF